MQHEAELKALANKSDEDIDYSDIPPSSDEQWSNAERGKFYRPLKTQASVRIDADVMEWLKRPGKGYQTRLNAILREAMLRDQNKNIQAATWRPSSKITSSTPQTLPESHLPATESR